MRTTIIVLALALAAGCTTGRTTGWLANDVRYAHRTYAPERCERAPDPLSCPLAVRPESR
jgi:hypothetical protein